MKKTILFCVSMLIGACVAMGATHNDNHNHSHKHNHPHGENVDKFKKNAISGHIFEYGSHEEIPFATIRVVEINQYLSAGEGGEFFIENLNDGRYTLRFQCVGYSAKDVIVEIKGHELKHFDVELEPSTDMLDDVVVSASRTRRARTW